MVRLLTKFNGRARSTIDGLRRAVEEGDWTTLKRDAHSLKGASGYVAATALKEASIALERSAEEALQGPPYGTLPAEALAHVEEEMALVLAAIGEATGEPPASLPPPLATGAPVPAVPAPAPAPAPADPTSGQASAAAASESTDTTPAINLNDVRSMVGGSDAVMARLLAKFGERAEATIDGMRRAVEEGDWATLKRDAHSLKGSSGYVAAMALKAAAEALEHTANRLLQGQPVGTSPKEALANVEREMARVLVAIEEATGEPPS